MAGGIALPQALQLISGVPLAKVGTVFAEKLSITKRLDGAAPASMIKQVLADGNLSSVMQNPMAGLTQVLQTQIANLAPQIPNIAGASGLISALTGSSGLSSALSAFQGAGDNLAGLTNGAAGFFSMLGHDQTAQMAGTAMPAQYATSVVTGPLTSGDYLSSLNTMVPQLLARVISGGAAADAAASWVTVQTTNLNGIVSASNAALAYSAAMHPLIATVASVAGSLAVPPTFDASGFRQEGVASGFQGVLASLVQPKAATALAASSAAQIAHTVHVPVDVTAMTSLGDD